MKPYRIMQDVGKFRLYLIVVFVWLYVIPSYYSRQLGDSKHSLVKRKPHGILLIYVMDSLSEDLSERVAYGTLLV